MTGKKRSTPTEWVDPDDAPELTDEFFKRADEFVGDRLVRRGRPKAQTTKVMLTVRYDADLIQAIRATGDGWQTRMNDALRHSFREVNRTTVVSKGSKTFPIGRDAKTGRLIPVRDARQRPSTTTVERMPKPGRGDTKK